MVRGRGKSQHGGQAMAIRHIRNARSTGATQVAHAVTPKRLHKALGISVLPAPAQTPPCMSGWSLWSSRQRSTAALPGRTSRQNSCLSAAHAEDSLATKGAESRIVRTAVYVIVLLPGHPYKLLCRAAPQNLGSWPRVHKKYCTAKDPSQPSDCIRFRSSI